MPADADAQGAMDKDLDLHPGFSHASDHVQAAFPGCYHPADAGIQQEAGAGGIVDGHLGAGMHLQAGTAFLDLGQYPQILHQNCVWFQLTQLLQKLSQLRPLPLLDQGVDRHIHPPAIKMGEINRFL